MKNGTGKEIELIDRERMKTDTLYRYRVERLYRAIKERQAAQIELFCGDLDIEGICNELEEKAKDEYVKDGE